MSQPIVTVLMPVYNAASYLREAIDSILTQTYRDFEFLIINDGSTDETEQIIKSYTDARIVYVKNETNLKLITTLNNGIQLSRGKYIVRMDGDDIALSNRIQKQIDFMESNPTVGLLGSFIRSIGSGNDIEIGYSTSHDEIKFKLLFYTHFPHPTAVIRRDVLISHNLQFEHKYIHCEDFVMWNKIAQVSQLAILPEILVLRRVHDDQISNKYQTIQETISSEIRKELLTILVPDLSSELMASYDSFLHGSAPHDCNMTIQLLDLYEKLIYKNRKLRIYNESLLEPFFKNSYWNLCLASTGCGMRIYKVFAKSLCFKEFTLDKKNKLLFFLKCLFRYNDKGFEVPKIIAESG